MNRASEWMAAAHVEGRADRDPVPSRLLGKFISETWSDYFDAVVVIRHEVAPTFDPWK